MTTKPFMPALDRAGPLFSDQPQDVGELPRNSVLGHLQRNIAAVADELAPI